MSGPNLIEYKIKKPGRSAGLLNSSIDDSELFLDCRKQQTDQDRDYRDHYKVFDQCEPEFASVLFYDFFHFYCSYIFIIVSNLITGSYVG